MAIQFNLYSPLQGNYSEALSIPTLQKQTVLSLVRKSPGIGAARRRDHYQPLGQPRKKGQSCIIGVQANGTKRNPLTIECRGWSPWRHCHTRAATLVPRIILNIYSINYKGLLTGTERTTYSVAKQMLLSSSLNIWQYSCLTVGIQLHSIPEIPFNHMFMPWLVIIQWSISLNQ